MNTRILITGASGSGTTTLGRAVASRLELPFFDADDYYWEPTEPPYRVKRDANVRRWKLVAELNDATRGAVVSGSVVNWGAEIENWFALIVFLTVPTHIRVERLRSREMGRFGRIDDEFIEWAAQYEEGRMAGRSRARHEQWLAERTCEILRIEGEVSIDQGVARVLTATSSN